MMPGRSSNSSRLKTPPPRKLEIDAELLANEQFSLVASFRSADFNNTHGYFSYWFWNEETQGRCRVVRLERSGSVRRGCEYWIHISRVSQFFALYSEMAPPY